MTRATALGRGTSIAFAGGAAASFGTVSGAAGATGPGPSPSAITMGRGSFDADGTLQRCASKTSATCSESESRKETTYRIRCIWPESTGNAAACEDALWGMSCRSILYHSFRMRERRFRVEHASELLRALLEAPLGLSRTEAKRLLRFRAISVTGHSSVRHDTLVAPGDVVTISASRALPSPEAGGTFPEIVYEDDAIVVLDKPAGLLTIATEAEKTRTAYRAVNEHLKGRARTSRQQIFVVHRLDRETSGLLVFARTEAAKVALQSGWKSVQKTYQAVVEGIPAAPADTLRSRLVETGSLLVQPSDRKGRLAVTRYRVLRSGAERSLLELAIETGRKNQIRVQLAEIGHPIVGDRKYGARTDPAGRLALHACELVFAHPVSGKAMRFRSELPASVRRLVL